MELECVNNFFKNNVLEDELGRFEYNYNLLLPTTLLQDAKGLKHGSYEMLTFFDLLFFVWIKNKVKK